MTYHLGIVVIYPATKVIVYGRVLSETPAKGGRSRSDVFNPGHLPPELPVADFSGPAKFGRVHMLAIACANKRTRLFRDPFLWCTNKELLQIAKDTSQ